MNNGDLISREAVSDNLTKGEKIKTHFAQVIVGGTAEKPCYSILYFEPTDKEYHIGFGSYSLDYVFQWLAEDFELIDEAPAVDVVEVVRCSKCKYGEIDDPDFPNQYLCHYDGNSWNNGEHFCGYGKLKMDGE